MIPGTIQEWKAALASSKPGAERSACVCALLSIGVNVEHLHDDGVFRPVAEIGGRRRTYRVKPTPRPWNAEDARRHVGKAWRLEGSDAIGMIGVFTGVNDSPTGFIPWPENHPAWFAWEGYEYAEPKWGTDPSAWNWKKCEVVE